MNKTPIKDVWQAFKVYLKQPKTLWDIKDYSFGLLTIVGGLLLITYIVVVFS